MTQNAILPFIFGDDPVLHFSGNLEVTWWELLKFITSLPKNVFSPIFIYIKMAFYPLGSHIVCVCVCVCVCMCGFVHYFWKQSCSLTWNLGFYLFFPSIFLSLEQCLVYIQGSDFFSDVAVIIYFTAKGLFIFLSILSPLINELLEIVICGQLCINVDILRTYNPYFVFSIVIKLLPHSIISSIY